VGFSIIVQRERANPKTQKSKQAFYQANAEALSCLKGQRKERTIKAFKLEVLKKRLGLASLCAVELVPVVLRARVFVVRCNLRTGEELIWRWSGEGFRSCHNYATHLNIPRESIDIIAYLMCGYVDIFHDTPDPLKDQVGCH